MAVLINDNKNTSFSYPTAWWTRHFATASKIAYWIQLDWLYKFIIGGNRLGFITLGFSSVD